MNNSAIQYLRRMGFNKQGIPGRKLLSRMEAWGPDDLLRHSNALSAQVTTVRPHEARKAISPFEFVGDTALAGGPFPCFEHNCRLSQVDAMTQFAALYADRILLLNPFGRLADELQSTAIIDKTGLQDNLYEFIHYARVIFHIHPFLTENIVQFIDFPQYCSNCYSKLTNDLQRQFMNRMEKEKNIFKKNVLKNVEFTTKTGEAEDYIEVNGPEYLVNHGIGIFRLTEEKLKLIGKKRDENIDFRLTGKQIRTLGLDDRLTDPIFSDLFVQNFCSSYLNVNYVIPRSRDNPEVCWVNDTEIVGDLVAISAPVLWHVVAQEGQHRDAEIRERGVALVVGDLSVHQPP